MTFGITYNEFRATLSEDDQIALDERAAVMQGGFYAANKYWQWEAGVSFVSCIGCETVAASGACKEFHIASPGYDFVVDNSAKNQVPKAFELLLTKEIKSRWPELFTNKKK